MSTDAGTHKSVKETVREEILVRADSPLSVYETHKVQILDFLLIMITISNIAD